jgi:hypothetical protein
MSRKIIPMKAAPARDTNREALAYLVHDTLHRGVFHTQRALRRWPAPRGHEARS